MTCEHDHIPWHDYIDQIVGDLDDDECPHGEDAESECPICDATIEEESE